MKLSISTGARVRRLEVLPRAALFMGAAALAGCATFSSDGGFDAVARTAQERLGKDVRWMRSAEEKTKTARETVQLLASPLSADGAVQVALLNNRSLQASFEELGVSEADLVQSGRLPNPRFTLRRSSADGVYDIEETVTVNVLSLLGAPYAHAIAKRRFAEVQSAVTLDVIQLAARTREAYFNALAARDAAHYLSQVEEAAQVGAELARRMRAAGNWNRLDEAREQVFHADAAVGLQRARLSERIALENLAQLLGVSEEAPELKLTERLPDPPQAVEEPRQIEHAALESRIDLQMMRERIDGLAKQLRLTKATRFVNVLDAGPTRVREGASSAPFEAGYEVTLEVPLFDAGTPRVRKAEAKYAQAVERFGQAALEARSEVRKAYARYRSAHEIAARERDELLPLRKATSEEDLLRYDAAQISVFDLLSDARAQIGGVNDYIQSVRDYWIAKSALDATLLGRAPPRSSEE